MLDPLSPEIVPEPWKGTTKIQPKTSENLSSRSESEISDIKLENVKETMSVKLERNG